MQANRALEFEKVNAYGKSEKFDLSFLLIFPFLIE